ncbi:MAG: hypothetical protein K6T66_08180 [Peptococcaceae bacterium]|nr:hypothetical protein [Peptococcaceae bacterium]
MIYVKIRELAGVSLEKISATLEKICLQCDYHDSPDCRQSACLVGYSRKVLAYAGQKGMLDIPGAHTLIPRGDFKPYYPETVAPVLAETCRQCKECRDNHNPDCVVALVRTSMENTVLSENINYPGSVFMYLAMVKEQHPELAALLAGELKKK